MAGDWIKAEKATRHKPEVLRISELLEIHPAHAFGLCMTFWFWCDDQLETCHAKNVTSVTLDHVVGHVGFATALLEVGWLLVRNGSLVIPNFDRHLSDSAKKRALSGERKRKQREKEGPQLSRPERDTSVTREEKRRVIKEREGPSVLKNSGGRKEAAEDPSEWNLPPPFAIPEMREVLRRWQRHQRENFQRSFSEVNAQALCAKYSQWSAMQLVAAIGDSVTAGWSKVHEDEPAAGPARKRSGKHFTPAEQLT